MPFTTVDAAALIQAERSDELLNKATQESVLARAATTVPMASGSSSLPIFSTLPEAEFVNYTSGDRTKPTSSLAIANKTLYAAEIAVIVPVAEETLEDADESLLDTIVARGAEAIGRRLDSAILFGNKGEGKYPEHWDNSLLAAATASGNVFQVGTGVNDLAGSLLNAAGAVAEGYDPSAAIAPTSLRYRIQNLRDETGAGIYHPSLSDASISDGSLVGLDAYFMSRDFDRTKAEAFVFDPSQVILGVRRDVSVKILTEATVNGINLAETDQIGLRFSARYGYVLGDNKAVSVVTPAAG